MYSNGKWDNSIVYKQDSSAITKAARADDSLLEDTQGNSDTEPTLAFGQVKLQTILVSSGIKVPQRKFVWSPENKRLLCSLIVTAGQDIDEIKNNEPFTELSTRQIEQQISSIVMQQNIGELRNKKYDIYALSKWNSGMIVLLSRLKVPGTIDASTGLLLVFPYHAGGFDKHPKYKKNLQARKKFIATFMKPNKFLKAVSKKHLADFLDELHKRQGYIDYQENLRCKKEHGKGAGKGPSGDAEMVAVNVNVPNLMTEINEMNAAVQNLHMFTVLKEKFGEAINFKTLLVHTFEQKDIFEEFSVRMAAMTELLKDSVLAEFTSEQQRKIISGPKSQQAVKYYQRLDQLAGEHVRREMRGLKLQAVKEKSLPEVQRQQPFEWVDPEDRSFANLDKDRRYWMRSLHEEGQLMLADLFYQSKPQIADNIENILWPRPTMERFQFLEAQTVPALYLEFSTFPTQYVQDFKAFCQVLNKKTEFDDFAASHSRGFTLNKPAILQAQMADGRDKSQRLQNQNDSSSVSSEMWTGNSDSKLESNQVAVNDWVDPGLEEKAHSVRTSEKKRRKRVIEEKPDSQID